MTVRAATVDDATGVAAVHVTSWRAAYAELLPAAHLATMSVSDRSVTWRATLDALPADQRVHVAELNGQVVGFARTGPSRDDDAGGAVAELRALYLLPELWGQGRGRLLHDHAASRWRGGDGRSANEGTLWVLGANKGARGFYKACGWVDDKMAMSRWNDAVRLDVVRYRLALGPED